MAVRLYSCDCQLLELGERSEISAWSDHRQMATSRGPSQRKSRRRISWRADRTSPGKSSNKYQFKHHYKVGDHMKDYNNAFLKCGPSYAHQRELQLNQPRWPSEDWRVVVHSTNDGVRHLQDTQAISNHANSRSSSKSVTVDDIRQYIMDESGERRSATVSKRIHDINLTGKFMKRSGVRQQLQETWHPMNTPQAPIVNYKLPTSLPHRTTSKPPISLNDYYEHSDGRQTPSQDVVPRIDLMHSFSKYVTAAPGQAATGQPATGTAVSDSGSRSSNSLTNGQGSMHHKAAAANSYSSIKPVSAERRKRIQAIINCIKRRNIDSSRHSTNCSIQTAELFDYNTIFSTNF